MIFFRYLTELTANRWSSLLICSEVVNRSYSKNANIFSHSESVSIFFIENCRISWHMKNNTSWNSTETTEKSLLLCNPVFSVGNKQKSKGVNYGEENGWGIIILFLVEYSPMLGAGALPWSNSYCSRCLRPIAWRRQNIKCKFFFDFLQHFLSDVDPRKLPW